MIIHSTQAKQEIPTTPIIVIYRQYLCLYWQTSTQSLHLLI